MRMMMRTGATSISTNFAILEPPFSPDVVGGGIEGFQQRRPSDARPAPPQGSAAFNRENVELLLVDLGSRCLYDAVRPHHLNRLDAPSSASRFPSLSRKATTGVGSNRTFGNVVDPSCPRAE